MPKTIRARRWRRHVWLPSFQLSSLLAPGHSPVVN
uniref:Uncharacterized protein n=1 Tax=Rhizophora mucronata TaxID=61149 RepID=A0A2P2MVH1_RHIMU